MTDNNVGNDTLRIAVVQPRSYSPSPFVSRRPGNDADEHKNLEVAEEYVTRAANDGVDFIVFPETYPGPTSLSKGLLFDDVVADMARQASTHGVAISYGGVRHLDSGLSETRHHLVTADGTLYEYTKMIPAMLETNAVKGTTPVVADIGKAKIGMAICWEAWFPEVARTLTFMGAEVLLFPTGVGIFELHDVWTAVLQARAAENVAFSVVTMSLVGAEEGMAYVFGPEGEEGGLREEGMIVADLDLARMREMRSVDQTFDVPFPYRTVPGTLRSLSPTIVAAYKEAEANRETWGEAVQPG